MKILKTLTAVMALLITFGVAESAMAAVGKIYGPVYLRMGKKSDHVKSTVLTFSAPVPGKGVVVIKNGGDSGKKSRVNSAKIKLNGKTIVKPSNFSNGHHRKFDKKSHKKHKRSHRIHELKVDVDLLSDNEIKVKIKSCKRCELEIYVMGELATSTDGVKPSGR